MRTSVAGVALLFAKATDVERANAMSKDLICLPTRGSLFDTCSM